MSMIMYPSRDTGNLAGSGLLELVTYCSVAGVVQLASHGRGASDEVSKSDDPPLCEISSRRICDVRVVHVPVALRASIFPRRAYEAGQELCRILLVLLDSAARDVSFLRDVVRQAASDEASRGSQNSFGARLQRMLGVLDAGYSAETSSRNDKGFMLALIRCDFMEKSEGQQPLGLVETNTISAAFSMVASRIQRFHRRQLVGKISANIEECGGYDVEVPVGASDLGWTRALTDAVTAWETNIHRMNLQTRPSCILFVVLEKEHLLCESLIEEGLLEMGETSSGIAAFSCHHLTSHGCTERLCLGGDGKTLILLDTNRVPIANVAVVYFRAGFTPTCLDSDAKWEARELIELSSAIKCPSAGWWLAGTKVVQAALGEAISSGRISSPKVSPASISYLLDALTPMRPVSSVSALLDELYGESGEAMCNAFVLKAEPLGIWSGKAAIAERMAELSRYAHDSARDHFLMRKLDPRRSKNVVAVRDGKVAWEGQGIQEIGYYGRVLVDENGEEVFPCECCGHLVRTKSQDVPDGGVCKGIAVLDSIYFRKNGGLE